MVENDHNCRAWTTQPKVAESILKNPMCEESGMDGILPQSYVETRIAPMLTSLGFRSRLKGMEKTGSYNGRDCIGISAAIHVITRTRRHAVESAAGKPRKFSSPPPKRHQLLLYHHSIIAYRKYANLHYLGEEGVVSRRIN